MKIPVRSGEDIVLLFKARLSLYRCIGEQYDCRSRGLAVLLRIPYLLQNFAIFRPLSCNFMSYVECYSHKFKSKYIVVQNLFCCDILRTDKTTRRPCIVSCRAPMAVHIMWAAMYYILKWMLANSIPHVDGACIWLPYFDIAMYSFLDYCFCQFSRLKRYFLSLTYPNLTWHLCNINRLKSSIVFCHIRECFWSSNVAWSFYVAVM